MATKQKPDPSKDPNTRLAVLIIAALVIGVLLGAWLVQKPQPGTGTDAREMYQRDYQQGAGKEGGAEPEGKKCDIFNLHICWRQAIFGE